MGISEKQVMDDVHVQTSKGVISETESEKIQKLNAMIERLERERDRHLQAQEGTKIEMVYTNSQQDSTNEATGTEGPDTKTTNAPNNVDEFNDPEIIFDE